MAVHDRKLLLGQRLRLLQDGIRESHLTDVVQQCAAPDVTKLRFSNAHPFGEGGCEFRHTLGMFVCHMIAHIQHA